MKNLLLLFLSATLLVSCQKNVTDFVLVAPLPEQTLPDVSYGSSTEQKMDVYLPAGRTTDSTKVIVLIHGGAWNAGDKTDFADYLAVLKQRLPNYVIFNINYRLALGSNLFPVQENDVQSALDFIVSKASEYKFNSSKLALLGASAGGHLALLQAYKHTGPKVKAVVDFFGPTDLTDMYNHPTNPLVPFGLQAVVGATPSTNATIYQQSSPINFVTAQSPPTIILQGGADPLVAVSQSSMLQTKLQSFSVTTQLVFYPTEGHGWVGANLTDSFDKIEAFLKANLH
jgi:acetyl esterase/lipase